MRQTDFVRQNWNRADQPDSSFGLTKLCGDPGFKGASGAIKLASCTLNLILRGYLGLPVVLSRSGKFGTSALDCFLISNIHSNIPTRDPFINIAFCLSAGRGGRGVRAPETFKLGSRVRLSQTNSGSTLNLCARRSHRLDYSPAPPPCPSRSHVSSCCGCMSPCAWGCVTPRGWSSRPGRGDYYELSKR